MGDVSVFSGSLYDGQRMVGRGRVLRSRESGCWRWVKCGLKMGLGLALVGLLCVVFHYVYQEIRRTSFFQLTRIEVTGHHFVPAEEICSGSGLVEGINLFEVDLEEVATRVREDIRIRDVRVLRKLPNRILISVRERAPVGLVVLDRLYGVDREGILMPPFEPSLMPDLPILTGLEDMGSFQVGDSLAVRCPRFKQALALLDGFEQVVPELLDRISEIHVDRSKDMELCLMDSGTRVHICGSGIHRALIGLRTILERLAVEGRLARSIDLRFKGQAVVRFE